MAKKQGSSSTKGTDKSQKKNQQKKGGQQARSGGPVKFARDVRGELKKVSWPNREQLQQSTLVVIIIVLVLMAYVYAWDFVFQNLSRLIFT
ncbi:MAG: preprotein translocase subunit SecE [Rubrobacteraceae bacterium]